MNRDDILLNSYMYLPQIIRKEETEMSFLNSYGSLFDNNPYSFSWREDNIQREVIQKLSRIRESHEHIFSNLDKDLSVLLNQRIMQVVSYLHKNNLIDEYEISFDNYTESCIDVRFSKRPDIVMSVYFDEPDMINDTISNVEVAYLTYKKNGKRRSINNTLDYILKEMVRLL